MRLICVGEFMLCFRPDFFRGEAAMDFSGDVLNTAAYACRALPTRGQVALVSAVGTDAVSDQAVAFVAALDIETDRIIRDPERTLGAYLTLNDASGERSFLYYRQDSAARRLFCCGNDAPLENADWIYFSGITLAILEEAARDRFLGHVERRRKAGATIAFDPNYRPRLWPDPSEAQRWMERAWRVTDIALPSIEDECLLWGGQGHAREVRERLARFGVTAGVVKNGSDGPELIDEPTREPFPRAAHVVDTTGAGDAFNGTYLASLMTGHSTAHAARTAHAVAMQVVGQPGAIVPPDRVR